MLRAAAARALRAGPSPLPSGAAPFSVLGFKDVLGAGAAEAATKLKQAVSGAMEGGPISSAPEEGPQAVGPAAAGESGGAEGTGRDEVPASDHGERLSAGGADVGPEERASTAGSPVAFEGDKVAAGGLGTEQTGAELPPLEGLEQTFAGGIEDRDDQEEALRPGHLRTFRDADPAEAARVPEQPSGLEEPFEDSSFKGV